MSEDFGRQADLVCEALCKEIASASRWSAVENAWYAILQVRRMEKSLVAEQAHLQRDTTP